ncbi:MAG: J domain-containing protein [Synechococcales bacterium]|nr:J domain-containing protein [Synechococcales bacterium]
MAKRKSSRSSSAKAKSDTTQQSKAPSKAGGLALTPLHQKLATLQEERQWLLKQIRRKRTELDNFMGQMREIVTELFQRGSESFNEVRNLDEEIHALFQEILTKRKLRKRSRHEVEDIYLALQMQGAISFRQLEQEWDDDDEFGFFSEDEGFPFGGDRTAAGGPHSSPFEPPPAEPEDASQASHRQNRDLRQTFLRLAAIYHPDRASDEDEQMQNTEVMKEINRAYKAGDFARLLELERQRGNDSMEAVISASDDLEQACQRLERENSSLQDQYEGIKAELRELRNQTQEGMMVTAYRRASREGIDFVEELLADSEMELESLRRIRDFVKDFRDRKITLKDFLAGPKSNRTPEDMLAELEDLLGVRVVVDPGFF